MDSDKHVIKAFLLNPNALPLQPAIVQREWMLNTSHNVANRCLPLRIANQFGWFLINDDEIEVTWNGGIEAKALTIHRPNGKKVGAATSHFGHGIVTWHVPYLFRTPPGYNLYVRGPTNFPKDGAYPLDGIIETDWAVATFTMNWKITSAGTPVHFGVGEPIAMIMPVARGELEKFEVVIEDLEKEPLLRDQHRAWSASRGRFISEVKKSLHGGSWQKHYFFGTSVEGSSFEGHQTSVELKPVRDNAGIFHRRRAGSPVVVSCPDNVHPDRNQRTVPSIFQRVMSRIRGRAS
ncbi:MAG: DUF6065 family protein [Candidatus Sulfotelmatobacter sp.]